MDDSEKRTRELMKKLGEESNMRAKAEAELSAQTR